MKNCLVADLDRCSGCDSCVAACKHENGIDLGVHLNRVVAVGLTDTFPNIKMYWLPLRKGEGVDERRKSTFRWALEELAAEHGLSHREKDVFRCLAMGYNSAAAAKSLQVSWNTVRTHTRNVYAKLNVHSRQELINLVDKTASRVP